MYRDNFASSENLLDPQNHWINVYVMSFPAPILANNADTISGHNGLARLIMKQAVRIFSDNGYRRLIYL